MIAIKPDVNQLFIAWCDRRDDPANSMIHIYGRFANIDASGSVSFPASEFRITTESFPPAFPGSLSENKAKGHYDPVWAPQDVDLKWIYPWWPFDYELGEPVRTLDDTYAHEHGEHNGAFADSLSVYVVWSDNRSGSQGTLYPVRNQSDIRLARISWPTY